jgi:plastocyanin
MRRLQNIATIRSMIKVSGFRLAALAAGLCLFSAAASAASITVKIENMQFSPKEIQANTGDSVTWTNADIVPHTVTEKKFKKGGTDSGTILPSQSFTLKITKALNYVCRFHPTMNGKIILKSSN